MDRTIENLDTSAVVPRFGSVYGPDQPHFPEVANRLFEAVGEFGPLARRLGDDRPFSIDRAAAAAYRLARMPHPPAGTVRAGTLADLSRGPS